MALEDPPVASKDKNLKVKILWGTVGQIRLCTKSSSNFPGVLPQERNFSVVLDVLTRFRSSDVEKAVQSLSSDQVDILMKYIYRGFAYPTENSCGILLVWHEKVTHEQFFESVIKVMTSL